MHCTGWVEPKSPKDGPVMESAGRSPGRRMRLAFGWGVGRRSGEKEGTEAMSRPGYGERQHVCFGDMVSCGWAGFKLTM